MTLTYIVTTVSLLLSITSFYVLKMVLATYADEKHRRSDPLSLSIIVTLLALFVVSSVLGVTEVLGIIKTTPST